MEVWEEESGVEEKNNARLGLADEIGGVDWKSREAKRSGWGAWSSVPGLAINMLVCRDGVDAASSKPK